MSIINDPVDVLGLAIKNLMTPLFLDEKFVKKVKKIKKRVVIIELEDIYSVSLVFNNGDVSIEYGEKPEYHLWIKITLDAFVGIAEGKVGMIGAFLKRKIRAKKLYRVFTILRFYKVFFPAIKAARQNPVIEGIKNLL